MFWTASALPFITVEARRGFCIDLVSTPFRLDTVPESLLQVLQNTNRNLEDCQRERGLLVGCHGIASPFGRVTHRLLKRSIARKLALLQ